MQSPWQVPISVAAVCLMWVLIMAQMSCRCLGQLVARLLSPDPAGEKLAQSQANDVGSLCNLGVICFLRQLLDTGFFHVSTVALHCQGVEPVALLGTALRMRSRSSSMCFLVTGAAWDTPQHLPDGEGGACTMSVTAPETCPVRYERQTAVAWGPLGMQADAASAPQCMCIWAAGSPRVMAPASDCRQVQLPASSSAPAGATSCPAQLIPCPGQQCAPASKVCLPHLAASLTLAVPRPALAWLIARPCACRQIPTRGT